MSSIPHILFCPPPRGVARTTRIESRQDCWRVIKEVAMLRLCWELKLSSDHRLLLCAGWTTWNGKLGDGVMKGWAMLANTVSNLWLLDSANWYFLCLFPHDDFWCCLSLLITVPHDYSFFPSLFWPYCVCNKTSQLTFWDKLVYEWVSEWSRSVVSDSATPWTVAHQDPPSMGFSRQEYWSGLPFPSPGDLPNPGIEPRSPALQADALTSEPPGKPWCMDISKYTFITLFTVYYVTSPGLLGFGVNGNGVLV